MININNIQLPLITCKMILKIALLTKMYFVVGQLEAHSHPHIWQYDMLHLHSKRERKREITYIQVEKKRDP
jgi:hypothetical protein